MVLTEPPPPEPSMMRMMGSLSSLAMRSASVGFMGMVASADPPRTVKSSPSTITHRPSILARPMTQLAGVNLLSLPSASYSALPAIDPISWKLCSSMRRSMRSRTVSRPPSCWRCTLSGPPISRAIRSRALSSSSSVCQLICRPHGKRRRALVGHAVAVASAQLRLWHGIRGQYAGLARLRNHGGAAALGPSWMGACPRMPRWRSLGS